MIEYGLLSRNVQQPEKFKEIRDERIKLKHAHDPRQSALKVVVNGTYGASKDEQNPLYDPRQANCVCIYGQLLILDLIEKLEGIGTLVQSTMAEVKPL
jgi:DNA polymerase